MYERDNASVAVLAESLGLSRQRVYQFAIEFGWQRSKSDQPAINAAAQRRADAQAQTPNELVSANAPVPGTPVVPIVRAATRTDPTNAEELAADEKSAEQRAGLLVKHRGEWNVARGLLQHSLGRNPDGSRGQPDMGLAKQAKVTAETLKLIQDGERKAYGLDTGDAPSFPGAPGASMTIHLVRETAPHAK
jgi:hypothetical protein